MPISPKLIFKRFWLPAALLSVMLFTVWGSLFSCQPKATPQDYKIRLQWVKAYPDETWSKVRTGFIWSLSYLGATVPSGSFDAAVAHVDSAFFDIQLDRLGFSSQALQALTPIITQLKQSDEYQVKGGVDLGRFLMLTLYSSWNYYAITGAAETLDEFKALHGWKNKSIKQVAVTNSLVAKHHRIIEFELDTNNPSYAFMATEGSGDLTHQSFTPQEYETVDIMPNGQIRVALYGPDGKLKTHGSPELTVAGKPGKCLWCHEMYLQPLFTDNPAPPSFLAQELFQDHIVALNHRLDSSRAQLDTDITFKNRQDHTYSELLYISFMEPSAHRLAEEWEFADSTAILQKLNLFPRHIYEEFPFLGQLYHRDSVDQVAPYLSVKVPSSAREASAYEPR